MVVREGAPSVSDHQAIDESVGPIGGQALLEGVMMRRGGSWGAAVRRQDGTIATTSRTLPTGLDGWRRLPLIRGVVALGETAGQLLVADGSQGRREVRVELKDDVLPGVSVSVYEDEGRVVADFVCANERSRERACAMAPELAAQLAQRLDRPTRVRVSTDDPEDPRLAETEAPGPRR